MPKFNERNALRNNIVHFKTEKSYVSADIRWETVIFAGIMRCGLFSYIGCVAILLLGYLPVWADGGRTGLLEVSPVAILLSENGAAPEENVSIRMIPIRGPLLLNSVLCGEMKTPGSHRMRLQTSVMNGTSLATQLSMIFS